jgi:hypothetical protein
MELHLVIYLDNNAATPIDKRVLDAMLPFTAKDWIYKNCTDVPIPRKWEITENIQILYKWIVKLGNGKYKVDVPGSYSERLSIN